MTVEHPRVWLNLKEAAAQMRVHPSTLMRMVRARKVSHARATASPHGPLRFRPWWLDAAMEQAGAPMQVIEAPRQIADRKAS